MTEFSDTQNRLLRHYKRRELSPGLFAELIPDLYRLLREKPENASLDPDWIPIWKQATRYGVGQFAPDDVYREIQEEIDTIPQLDEAIFTLPISRTSKIVFLLGAGASVPSGIPAVKDLLPELWKRARKIGRADLNKLSEWCEERRITNIEDLLTAAYFSNYVSGSNALTSLLDYFLFGSQRASPPEEAYYRARVVRERSSVDTASISFLQDTLQTLFGLLTSTMILVSPNPTHTSITEFVKAHRETSIVTTNYDGCMDEALSLQGLNVRPSFIEEPAVPPASDAIELIKMHGSINWSYCDSCQDTHVFDLPALKRTYQEDTLSYPIIGICKSCGGLRRPLLVPPLSFKFLLFPNLIKIWEAARQSIERADYIVTVGYSFSLADTYITKIVTRSMTMHPNQKLIIINRDHDLATSLKTRFSDLIDGFDKRRILSATQTCEVVLPRILINWQSKLTREVPQGLSK